MPFRINKTKYEPVATMTQFSLMAKSKRENYQELQQIFIFFCLFDDSHVSDSRYDGIYYVSAKRKQYTGVGFVKKLAPDCPAVSD